MSDCTSADIAIFQDATLITALGKCAMPDDTASFLPTGTLIESCLTDSGVSTTCSACWNDFYSNIMSCMQEECLANLENPKTSDSSCIDCLTKLSEDLEASGDTICGVDSSKLDGLSASDVREEINNLLATKSSTSLRAVTTSVIVFALLMIAM